MNMTILIFTLEFKLSKYTLPTLVFDTDLTANTSGVEPLNYIKMYFSY